RRRGQRGAWRESYAPGHPDLPRGMPHAARPIEVRLRSMTRSRPISFLGAALVLLLKALLVVLVVALPVLGVWVSSSLAAYSNGPVWATVLAGLLLFPLLPVCWELFARWRKARRRRARNEGRLGEIPREILTTGDRILLRTVALNALFLGGLLATRPAV